MDESTVAIEASLWRRIADRFPTDPPFVDVGAFTLIVGICPSYRREQHIFPQGSLNFVEVPSAMWVVFSDALQVHVFFQPADELGSEAHLERAPVRLFMVQRELNSLSLGPL
jgi:hypothetical protein